MNPNTSDVCVLSRFSERIESSICRCTSLTGCVRDEGEFYTSRLYTSVMSHAVAKLMRVPTPRIDLFGTVRWEISLRYFGLFSDAPVLYKSPSLSFVSLTEVGLLHTCLEIIDSLSLAPETIQGES